MLLLPISNIVDSPGVPEDLKSPVSLQLTLYYQVNLLYYQEIHNLLFADDEGCGAS
jgi:hypothetical protein